MSKSKSHKWMGKNDKEKEEKESSMIYKKRNKKRMSNVKHPLLVVAR